MVNDTESFSRTGTKFVASALIKNQDKMLLVRRTDYDVWEIPGGGIEFGESPEQAALREVEEETGLKVDIKNIIDSVSVTFDSSKDKTKRHIVVIAYECDYCGGEVVLNEEHSEYKWMSACDALKIENLALGMKHLLEKWNQKNFK